jgi:hypothetical protein
LISIIKILFPHSLFIFLSFVVSRVALINFSQDLCVFCLRLFRSTLFTMARHQRIALIARHLSTAGPTQTGPTAADSAAKAVQKQVFRGRTDYKYFLPVQTR